MGAHKRKKVDAQKPPARWAVRSKGSRPTSDFTYRVEAGQLHWERKADLIAQGGPAGRWYSCTNETVERCSGEQVLGHYKGLLEVEEAFREPKATWRSARCIITGPTE